MTVPSTIFYINIAVEYPGLNEIRWMIGTLFVRIIQLSSFFFAIMQNLIKTKIQS